MKIQKMNEKIEKFLETFDIDKVEVNQVINTEGLSDEDLDKITYMFSPRLHLYRVKVNDNYVTVNRINVATFSSRYLTPIIIDNKLSYIVIPTKVAEYQAATNELIAETKRLQEEFDAKFPPLYYTI